MRLLNRLKEKGKLNSINTIDKKQKRFRDYYSLPRGPSSRKLKQLAPLIDDRENIDVITESETSDGRLESDTLNKELNTLKSELPYYFTF